MMYKPRYNLTAYTDSIRSHQARCLYAGWDGVAGNGAHNTNSNAKKN